MIKLIISCIVCANSRSTAVVNAGISLGDKASLMASNSFSPCCLVAGCENCLQACSILAIAPSIAIAVLVVAVEDNNSKIQNVLHTIDILRIGY